MNRGTTINGRALFDGILLESENVEVRAVRNRLTGSIDVTTKPLKLRQAVLLFGQRIDTVPILRGIYMCYESLPLYRKHKGLTLFTGVLVLVALFFGKAPLNHSNSFFNDIGMVFLFCFLSRFIIGLYNGNWVVRKFPALKNINLFRRIYSFLGYQGATNKVLRFTKRNGLVLGSSDNVQTFSRFSCASPIDSLLFYMITLLSYHAFFYCIGLPLVLDLLLSIALYGAAYELLELTKHYTLLADIEITLQKYFSTVEPTNEQVAVSIVALEALVAATEDLSNAERGFSLVYYIVNALAIAFNGSLLLGCLLVVNLKFPLANEVHKVLLFVPEKYALETVTISVMLLFIAIGLSPFVDAIMRYLKGYRGMLRDEKELFDAAFRQVIEQMSIMKNETYEIGDYKLYVLDSERIESDHLGIRSLAVSRKMLHELRQDEVSAALAHEVGHLSMGHGVHIRVFFAVTILGQLALWFTKRFLQFFKNLYALELPVISWSGIFGVGLFHLVKLLVQLLLLLPLIIGGVVGFRQTEYKADQFVLDLGFGEGLHSYLIRSLDETQPTHDSVGKVVVWFKQFIWPTAGKRLVEIEKLQAVD